MPERYADLPRAEAISRLSAWQQRAREFSGWSFDLLGIRDLGPPKPWRYEERVRRAAASRRAVLDLGTGGGERLAEVRSELPRRAVATEEWHVNAPVARARLQPLAVEVVRASSLELPFGDATFDLVIDRHEAWEPREVMRVLAADGVALTQQVARADWREARRRFARYTEFPDHQRLYAEAFATAGFDVTVEAHEGRVAYPSLGEFAFMLFAAPWSIPDLDPERDLEALLAIETDCLTDDGLVVTDARYLLQARRR